MLSTIIDLYGSQGWDWRITALVTIIAPFLTTYLVTSWNSTSLNNKIASTKRPPTLPYAVPWVGHIISFALDGRQLLLGGIAKFGPSVPFKLQMPLLIQFNTNSPEHVNALFKIKGASGNQSTTIAMENSFGSPRSAVAFYEADDSGYLPTPRPDSKVKPGDRIMYDIHKLVNNNLSGESLAGITSRFQKSLAQQLSDTNDISDEWTDIPDLYAFMKKQVMEAAIVSMFGTYILSLNPTFMEDFWRWNKDMGTLYLGFPRWLIPSAYRNRTKIVNNVIKWHKYAHEHFDCTKVGPEDIEWEPYFGSKFSRRRQVMFGRWEALDETAKAAEDLGFIWAANANAIPAATWFLLELLLDRSLESRIHNEFSSALIAPEMPSRVPTFDVNKLCAGPLCQSIWAETLRLRVGVVISRRAYEDINFCGWEIKKGEAVTVSSSSEALNETIWNSGSESDPHPLEKFWADRFLIYPNDPTSGPLKKPESKLAALSVKQQEDKGIPKFSLEGVSNSWIPFSGGPRHCPGRHFAKQEMISSAAIMLAACEIELTTKPGWIPDIDKSYFGFGTMPPKGKIPCRIRRRQGAF